MNRKFDGSGLKEYARNVPNVMTGRPSIPCFMASMLSRVCSLNNLCRTITRDNFANVMRPKVAAVAATTASEAKFMLGTVRPMNDMAVHVGAAKAGRRLSTKITMNSKTIISVVSPNSITVDLCVYPPSYGFSGIRKSPCRRLDLHHPGIQECPDEFQNS